MDKLNHWLQGKRIHAALAAVAAISLLGLVSFTGCGSSNSNASSAPAPSAGKSPVNLLNVSYDPTRELYVAFNAAFAQHWKETTGQTVTIDQSHGGASAQARAVIDGLKADVVTLAQSIDIDQIADLTKAMPKDWQSRLPHNSCPYTSTIVFLVRKGNPKGIKDWGDLVNEGVEVITPNPKTSGGARYNYLAAWGYALRKNNNDPQKAREFVTELYKHVPVLDTGARGSTTTFVQRKIGDVLLAWENEALLAVRELGPEEVELVVPPLSILAEPPVAVLDKNASTHDALEVANAYLKYLYTPEGQTIVAKNFYRPSEPDTVDKALLAQFPKVELFKLDSLFGSWAEAQKTHFSDGGVFDSIYVPKK